MADRLTPMLTFVRIVETGSLSAAARAMDRSLPAVCRSLAQLETRLGARLLNRTTRRIGLTDTGAQFYERCRQIVAAQMRLRVFLVYLAAISAVFLWLAMARLVPFPDTLDGLQLSRGAVSNVIETSTGFHLLQCVEKFAMRRPYPRNSRLQALPRHILDTHERADQSVTRLGLAGRERKTAIAHDHGGDAVFVRR